MVGMNVQNEIKLCKCGCGESVTQRRDGSYNDFINHHHIRLNNPFSSDSFRERMTGENNPAKRPEVREKISKNLKGVYVGEKNHMKQDKYRKMFSEMWMGENNPMYGKKCPENSERMKNNNPMFDKEISKKSLEHRMKISQCRKRENNMSEDDILWNEFITPIQEKIRKLIEYKNWRNKIYERDNYICVSCGYDKGKILNAHHNKFFCKIITENKITTIEEAKECQELWDINNGITLCKKCHIEIHKKEKDND